jgi:hypothetical protein
MLLWLLLLELDALAAAGAAAAPEGAPPPDEPNRFVDPRRAVD